MLQLSDGELMVEEAIPEFQIAPNVHFLGEQLIVFQPSLGLDQLWVEEALGDLHVTLILDHLVHGVDATSPANFAPIFASVEPRVRDARDKPDEGIFRADDFLNKTKIVTEGSLVNPDPLVRLNW